MLSYIFAAKKILMNSIIVAYATYKWHLVSTIRLSLRSEAPTTPSPSRHGLQHGAGVDFAVAADAIGQIAA